MKKYCPLLAGFLVNFCIDEIIYVPAKQSIFMSGINAVVGGNITIPFTPFSSKKYYSKRSN
ncbi:MAG: hypothetical protein K8R74_05025 [Bacteroidales bacterium]|nr:hypothetical protein [Bacteroidales bacterium]